MEKVNFFATFSVLRGTWYKTKQHTIIALAIYQ